MFSLFYLHLTLWNTVKFRFSFLNVLWTALISEFVSELSKNASYFLTFWTKSVNFGHSVSVQRVSARSSWGDPLSPHLWLKRAVITFVPRTKEQSLIEINQSKWIVLQITFSRLHSGSEGYQNGNSERGIKSSNLQYKKV